MTAMRLKRYPSPSGGFALGKMGVGATMLKQGKTARDYVQDSCLWMLDGIENAGFGVHDFSYFGNPNDGYKPSDTNQGWCNLKFSQSNKNRIGINAFAPSDIPDSDLNGGGSYATKGYWEDNGFVFTKNANGGAVASDYAIWYPLSINDFTAEFCFKLNQNISAYSINFASFFLDRGTRRFYYYADPNYTYTNQACNNFSALPVGVPLYVAIVHIKASSDVLLYLNGSLVSTTTLSTPIGRSNYVISPINYSGDGTKVFSQRRHTRALTASEIAANYAIDKERFNLP